MFGDKKFNLIIILLRQSTIFMCSFDLLNKIKFCDKQRDKIN